MAARTPLPQRIAEQLDALVGHLRAGEEQADKAEDVAAAIATAWSEHANAVITLSGAQLAVADRPVLSGTSDNAQWILPASLAGLRALKPAGSLAEAEVRALAEQLGRLGREHGTLEAFRDWLWCGGCAGFEVQLQASLLDRPGAFVPTEAARQQLDVQRARRAQEAAVQFARRRQSQDVLHQQAGQQSQAYLRGLADKSVGLDAATATALRLEAEDGAFWAEQVVVRATGNEALMNACAPAATARLILSAFGGGPTLDALDAVQGLQVAGGAQEPAASEGDEAPEAPPAQAWLDAVRDGISDQDLGRAVGRGLRLDEAAVQRLSDMMRDVAMPFSVGVATGLLERAGGGDPAIKEVAALCQQVGLRQLWSQAQLEGLSEPVARGVAMVLKLADAGAEFYADLVLASPATVAAWILRNAPPHVSSRIESRLHHLFRTRDPSENLPLIETLIATGSQSSVRALAEVFVQSKGKGWVGQVVPDLCGAIVEQGLAADFLVPLFRDRDAEPKLRLLVLRSLEDQPAALAEAVKFRPTDLMEPKEIQARLKAARKRLKG